MATSPIEGVKIATGAGIFSTKKKLPLGDREGLAPVPKTRKAGDEAIFEIRTGQGIRGRGTEAELRAQQGDLAFEGIKRSGQLFEITGQIPVSGRRVSTEARSQAGRGSPRGRQGRSGDRRGSGLARASVIGSVGSAANLFGAGRNGKKTLLGQ
jgi:hypothetical protein